MAFAAGPHMTSRRRRVQKSTSMTPNGHEHPEVDAATITT